MIQKYYIEKMQKAEDALNKECETCLDYGVCWASNSLQETACNNWKPDFMLIQEMIKEGDQE